LAVAVAAQAGDKLQAISDAVEVECWAKQAESFVKTHETGNFGESVSDTKLLQTIYVRGCFQQLFRGGGGQAPHV